MASIVILRPHLRYTSNTMERGKVCVKQTQLDSECWNHLALISTHIIGVEPSSIFAKLSLSQ